MSSQNFLVTSRAAVADFFGVGETTVTRWVARGMPGDRRNYDLAAIAQWREHSFREELNEIAGDPELFSGGGSPALEEFRRHRAELARLDVEERTGKLVDGEKLKSQLRPIADFMRSRFHEYQKRYGNEVVDLVQEVFDIVREKFRELG